MYFRKKSEKMNIPSSILFKLCDKMKVLVQNTPPYTCRVKHFVKEQNDIQDNVFYGSMSSRKNP